MQLIPLSLSIGILAAIWTYVSSTFGLLTWPAFVGWALFFLAGANKEALSKNVPPMLSGVILGHICVLVYNAISGSVIILALFVGVIAFVMTFMMNIPAFATAPAAFASCATYFGAGDPIKAAVPLLIGLFLGIVSVMLPELFKTGTDESKSA